MCHGTYHPANSTYGMLDYVMKAQGHKNYHVGTIEGYPTIDDVIRGLESNKAKEVISTLHVRGRRSCQE